MIAMLRRRLMGSGKKMYAVKISGFQKNMSLYASIKLDEQTLENGTYNFKEGTELYCSAFTNETDGKTSIELDGELVAWSKFARYTLVLNSDCIIKLDYFDMSHRRGWIEITTLREKLILSYDAQGGSGSFEAQKGVADSTGYATFVIPNYSPSKSGYTFIGWALTPTAATAEYGSGDSIKINNDTTLYAVYREQSQPQPDVYYTVTVSDGSEQGSTANCTPSIGGTGTYNVKGGSSITLYCFKNPNPDSDTAYIIVNGTNVITNTTRGSKMSYTYYVNKNCTISVYGHGLSTSTSVS